MLLGTVAGLVLVGGIAVTIAFDPVGGQPLADAAITAQSSKSTTSTPTSINQQLLQEAKSRAAQKSIPERTQAPPTATPTPRPTQTPAYIPPTTPTSSPSIPAAAPTTVAPTPTSSVVATVSGTNLGARVLAEAETMKGVPYVYGGDTPAGFDCSGLVYWASQQLGITGMPRDTYEMLSTGVANGTLIPTSNPQPGDLAFFGSGHVEFVTSIHDTTFGAQQSGTLVGFNPYNPPGYAPTAYYVIT